MLYWFYFLFHFYAANIKHITLLCNTIALKDKAINFI